jgi:hypothetical protein
MRRASTSRAVAAIRSPRSARFDGGARGGFCNPPSKENKMSELRILNRSGDRAVVWNPNDDASWAEARATIRELQAQNHTIFSIGSDGMGTAERGEPPRTAALLVAVPLIVGG